MSANNTKSKSLATKAMTLASQRLGNLPYTRPSEWMTLPTVLDTDQKFVGLHMVTVDSCFCALSAAGAYTVDWGDGTTQNIATGVTAYHQYDYATLTTTSTSDATITSFGYKQAIVTVTPQAGQQLTSLNLNVKHNQTGLQLYSSGFVDVAIASPYLVGCFIGATNTSGTQSITMQDLEIVNIVTSAVLNFSFCLYGCYSLQSVDTMGMSSCTNATSMFQNCRSLQTVPLFNLAACTNANNMFSGCPSLQTVPLFNLGACTNATGMFQSCSSLVKATCSGTKVSITYLNCMLSATQLNAIYTNLASGVVSQTITVTGNWGAATDTPSIATAKGWTVTG